jgi:hypothetical protein
MSFAGKLGNKVKEIEGTGSFLSPHFIFRHESLCAQFENESQNGQSYKNCIVNLFHYSKKQKLNMMEITDHTYKVVYLGVSLTRVFGLLNENIQEKKKR